MSTGTRVALATARYAAETLIEALAPACERIEIAGSIRRDNETVGDIELVAIPRVTMEELRDGLFGQAITERDHLAEAVLGLVERGVLTDAPGRGAAGPRYTKLLHRLTGLQLDLFTVRPPATWGVIFLIRTGPAVFSQWVVSEARRQFFHVADGALHRGSLGCAAVPCEVVDTPEETDFLAALGIGYRPPQMREATFR